MSDKNLTYLGERAAMSGYRAQYVEFGIRVYDALRDGSLVEIRIADMEKNVGKLDDICYVTSSEVHGYQLKWSNAGKTFKFSDFLDVIGGIADGWRGLREAYPGKRVYAHLLTNRRCSSRDRIKDADGVVVRSFCEFVLGCLACLQKGKIIDTTWSAAVLELRSKTGLSGENWNSFWKSFVFTPDYEQESIRVRDSMAVKRVDDIILLMDRIQEEVADKNGRTVLSSVEIMELFKGRMGTTYNHNLLAPVERFEPNKGAMVLLDKALTDKTKGYILLQGSPGSGKSTLLTQWADSLPNKSVRYYAFDFLNPSSNRNSESDRGDRVTFLYDMVQMLRGLGFRASDKAGGDTLSYREFHFLKNCFYSLLEDASSYYQASGLPLVIVVDGLDHITREYARQNRSLCSLLTVLPSMSDLPFGVVFVLGSQHYDFDDLDSSIRAQAFPEQSLVTMPPLDRYEVEALLLRKFNEADVDTSLVDQCFRLSQGHPLYLSYIINQLNSGGVSSIDSIPVFSGDVEEYYNRQLDRKTLNNLSSVLGLLCRVPGKVSLDAFDVWGVTREQKQKLSALRHLFRLEGKSISFFHNSFRQYLIYKTAEDPFLPGKLCEKDDRAYYAKLYGFDVTDWNAGYFLFQAGNYDEFISRITPDALYAQMQEFRPSWSVRQDIRFGAEIARRRRDPYLLARYILFESQLGQMERQSSSTLTLVRDFLRMGKVSLAKRLVRDDNGLRCSQSRALSLARVFMHAGEVAEAKTLFELGYPSFMHERIDPRNKSWVRSDVDIESWLTLSSSWVEAAVVCGYPINYVREHVKKFCAQLATFASHYEIEFDGRKFLEDLKVEYVSTLINLLHWDEVKAFMTDVSVRPSAPLDRLYIWEQALVSSNDVGDSSLTSEFYGQMVVLFSELIEEDRPYLLMAFVSQLIGMDATTIDSYLSRVSWDSLDSFYLSSGDEFSHFDGHICYARLRAYLGYSDSVAEYAPENNTKRDNSTMYYYARRVFKLAQYLGKVQAGYVEGRAFLSDADAYLKSFDNLPGMMRDIYSFTISRQRKDFYEYMVEVAAGLGEGVLSDFACLVEAYFSSSQCKADANAKRTTILALSRKGIPANQCIRMLELMEPNMMNDQDVNGRIEQSREQGRAWLEFHHEDCAEKCFRQMIRESFGVGYRKDYQPSVMAEWIGAAIKNNPDGADARIQWLTSRLKYLASSTESDKIARYAARALLPQVLDYNLGAGVKLAKWLLDEQWCSFQIVLAKLLVALIGESKTFDELNLLVDAIIRLYFYTLDESSSDFSSTIDEVLESLVERVRQMPQGVSSPLLGKLRKDIKIWALPTLSPILLTQLDGLLNLDPESGKDRVRDCDAVIAEARQLMAAGLKEAAWDRAIEALALSNKYGWDRWADGGTRLNASIALEQIDKERGREVVFDKVTNDVSKEYTIGMRDYLSEIVPLLTDSVDQERLFLEEWEYMNRILREDTVALEDRPDVSPESIKPIETLSIFLVYTADLPVMAVSEQAKMLLAQFIEAGYGSIIPFLSRSERPKTLQLEIGMFLRALDSPRLSAFKDIAKEAAISNNYLHRVYAKKILGRLGEQVPVSPYRRLPATYNLVFPSADDLASLTTAQRLAFLAGNEDIPSISSTMRIGAHITGYLSDLTGIPKLTLEVRADTLMKQHSSSCKYLNTEVHLRNIGLRFAYRKDGVLETLDSIYEVVAELIDAHRIQSDDEVFEDVVRPYDFNAILIHPEEKPAFIELIQTEDNWSLPANWRNNAQYSPRLDGNLPQLDDNYVLAEITYLCKPISEDEASEEFKSKLSFYGQHKDATFFFGDAPFQLQSEDYLTVGDEDPQIILWRNGRLIVGSHLSRWIAINPACARALGWKSAADGLFAWNDSTGAPMVHSLYWHGGNPTCKSLFCHPTAEGWLVLATPDALTRLQEFASNHGRPLYIHQSLSRSQHVHPRPEIAYKITRLE